MSTVKCVLIICDGLGDRPIEELGGNTPLEAANKPNLDHLASVGINGMMHPIGPGITPGSDTSHLSIFGYDPYTYYTGRGPFEVLGMGLPLGYEDIAFRGNFATVEEKDGDLVVLDRRAGRRLDEGDELARSLNGMKLDSHPDVDVGIEHSVEHRCSVTLKGSQLSHRVTDTDPHIPGRPLLSCQPISEDKAAQRTAEIVNLLTSKSHAILSAHEANKRRKQRGLPLANAILLRGAGVRPRLPSLREKYGLRAACIAGAALYAGVAVSVGMELLNVKGATGTIEVDTLAVGRATVEALTDYDFVFVHIKGADNAGHDGDWEMKMRMVKKIDGMIGVFRDSLDLESTCLAVTADHSTPCEVGEHTGDPVPIVIAGPGVRTDDVTEFGERQCAKGGLSVIRGLDLMPLLMNLLGRTEKFGS
ncbi:MAG: 2,3-bisphosphoglycerate-independent phosphoglycerate mutase [Candidatus Geothermarchaeales archaeon]